MARGAVRCGQCGETVPPAHGRCRACGAALVFGDVAAADRRAALLDVLGSEWYWWVGEAFAVGAVIAVAAGLAPVWLLGVAVLLLLRPLARAIMRLVRSVIEGTP